LIKTYFPEDSILKKTFGFLLSIKTPTLNDIIFYEKGHGMGIIQLSIRLIRRAFLSFSIEYILVL